MATTVRKQLLGKEDTRYYTAASPTFTRTTSTGAATTVTAIAATHIPLVQSAASLYWSANNVQRAINEGISRYFAKNHSIATYGAGGGVGDHVNVFGFRNALAATSIQAAASNMFLRDGVARIFIPNGTYTVATPINLPRKTILYGNGESTIIRASSTIQTSKIFNISGSVGATSSNLNANATMNTLTLPVVNGGLFSAGQDVLVKDSQNAEINKIISIAGNSITIGEKLRHTYRSAATVASVTIAYPAELTMDTLLLRGSSATQGIGISCGTIAVSHIRTGVVIERLVTGVKANTLGCLNIFEPTIRRPSSNSAGKGYGVWLADKNSHDNILGGFRQGVKDVSAGGYGNFVMGNHISAQASGLMSISDKRSQPKPQLSHTTYSVSGTATRVLTCGGSTTNPADVLIDGRLYRNTGTILGDASRTRLPTAATVGGFDRGPATATRAFYVYAVPSRNPSATRQWDMLLSTGAPSSGPTAAATFPSWSFLGAFHTAASVRVVPFTQSGDQFYNRTHLTWVTTTAAALATWRVIPPSGFLPTAADAAYVNITAFGQTTGVANDFYVTHPTTTNVNDYALDLPIGAVAAATMQGTLTAWTPCASGQVAYRVAVTAANVNYRIRMRGFSIPRNAYK